MAHELRPHELYYTNEMDLRQFIRETTDDVVALYGFGAGLRGESLESMVQASMAQMYGHLERNRINESIEDITYYY